MHKLGIPGTVYYDDGLDHLSDYYCDEAHKYFVLTDEASFKTSYLETHDNLETAIHLYEKCDYTEIPRPDFVKHSAMTRFFTKAL